MTDAPKPEQIIEWDDIDAALRGLEEVERKYKELLEATVAWVDCTQLDEFFTLYDHLEAIVKEQRP